MFGAGGVPAYAAAAAPSLEFAGDANAKPRRGASALVSRSGEEKKRKRTSQEAAHQEKTLRDTIKARGKDADDAGSDSIMTGQPGPSEGAPEVSARNKTTNAEGVFGASVPKKSRSGRPQKKNKEGGPKKDQSAADILVSIANA
jgi:hypothetical protein